MLDTKWIQAPMAGVQDAGLAIAVCRAGGIGSLPTAAMSAETLLQQWQRLHDAAAGAVYNVNFFAHSVPVVSEDQHQRWLDRLQPYWDAFGVERDSIAMSAGRRAFDEEALEWVRHFRPPVVSFHFGLPEPRLLQAVRQSGACIWSSATTVREAQWLAAQGVDAVIAQGWEAGGHRGWFLDRNCIQSQSGLFALLPNIVRSIDVPVIAAGGIADAATARAAFALGASAVQIGTAFLLADEAQTPAAHRAALQSEAVRHTAVTRLFTGGGARGLINRMMRELAAAEADAPPFPYAAAAAVALRQAAERQGDYGFTPMWCGQNAALAQTGSAAEILAAFQAA